MNKNDILTSLLTSLLVENADALLPELMDLAQQHPFLTLVATIWGIKQLHGKKSNNEKDKTLD
ncbi:hypothetical protein [Bacillus paramycoides]|uniref:hypothetical protein n=1 Tax=Bacillus paramycoides TaxID=2026194 RepID=UPI002E1F837E|nr:hypothetical protein [Bacillus paramycoides]